MENLVLGFLGRSGGSGRTGRSPPAPWFLSEMFAKNSSLFVRYVFWHGWAASGILFQRALVKNR